MKERKGNNYFDNYYFWYFLTNSYMSIWTIYYSLERAFLNIWEMFVKISILKKILVLYFMHINNYTNYRE